MLKYTCPAKPQPKRLTHNGINACMRVNTYHLTLRSVMEPEGAVGILKPFLTEPSHDQATCERALKIVAWAIIILKEPLSILVSEFFSFTLLRLIDDTTAYV